MSKGSLDNEFLSKYTLNKSYVNPKTTDIAQKFF